MRRKRWWMVALVLYILFIFGNSMQTATVSSGQSGAVLKAVVSGLTALGMGEVGITEHIIRKMAHFAEYTLLGILIFQNAKLRFKGRHGQIPVVMAAGFFVPFIDETIQLFVEGRSGQISDVWLDIAGVLFGILLVSAVHLLPSRRKRRNVNGKKYKTLDTI